MVQDQVHDSRHPYKTIALQEILQIHQEYGNGLSLRGSVEEANFYLMRDSPMMVFSWVLGTVPSIT
jgi:hypothetical protein